MRRNKFLLFLAGISIFAQIGKIVVNLGGAYMITQGWGNTLVINLLSIYILAKSIVKHKWVYALLGAVAYIAIVCLLATLSMFGIVYHGW